MQRSQSTSKLPYCLAFSRARLPNAVRTVGVFATLAVIGWSGSLWHAYSCCAAQPSAEVPERLQRLDGSSFTANVASIDSDGVVSLRETNDRVPLEDLRAIERPAAIVAPEPKTPNVLLELAGGSAIQGRSVMLRDDRLLLEGPPGGPLDVEIDAARLLRLHPPKEEWEAHLQRATETTNREFDRVLFLRDEKLDMIRGLVTSLDAGKLTWEREGRSRELPRRDLYGIVFAQIQQAAAQTPPHVVISDDGSSWSGYLERLENDLLTLRITTQSRIQLPWRNVLSVQLRSDRLVYLSDLEPAAAFHEPIVTATRSWQRDASVDGRPLTLSGEVYSKGLGTASYSELAYDLDGAYVWLAARIGIDDETEGHGDCVFVVLGDGRELFRRRIRPAPPDQWGREQTEASANPDLGPQAIRVEIEGIRRLTLRVEPGADLDLADHADWCDLCLIRGNEAK